MDSVQANALRNNSVFRFLLNTLKFGLILVFSDVVFHNAGAATLKALDLKWDGLVMGTVINLALEERKALLGTYHDTSSLK